MTIVAAVVIANLTQSGWEPSVFAGFGEEAGGNTEFIIETLGSDVVLRSGLGHDGRFFFVQALDPFIADPGLYRETMDHPSYRAQRMFYPLIAGGFGLLDPDAVVWGMLLVNAVALVAGTVVTARLANSSGLTPWLGLSFLLNPGLIDELAIGGGGILALGLLLSGVLALERSRQTAAGLLFLGAVLAREVMLLPVLALVVYDWHWSRRIPWTAFVYPLAGIATWYMYVQSRLTSEDMAAGSLTPVPFASLPESISIWSDSPFTLVLGLILLLGGPYSLWRATRTRVRSIWATGSVFLLVPFLTVQVMADHFNLNRALAPVFVAIPFAAFEHWRSHQKRLGMGVGGSRQ